MKSNKVIDKLSENSTFEGDKVPKLTKIIYPWSGIFRDACYALVGTFLMQYIILGGHLSSNVDTYQAQMSVVTIALMVALIWDGLDDPIMGFIIEKCHFKLGKFRPWILIGAIGNAVVVALMFALPVYGWAYVGMMIALYFVWDFFFTMNDIGYWSMLPSLTNDPKERASLTTQVTVATTIGAFLMNILMFILPGGGKSSMVYGITGVATALLFLIAQTLVFFLCKEKKRDPKQDEISSQAHFLDLFKIVGKNKQLLRVVIAMFLYYLAAGLLTGIGLNYFYLLFGYGGDKGGLVASLLSIVYVVGTLASQVFYPLMAKKFRKQNILTVCTVVIILTYVAFLFFAFPIFGGKPLAYNDPSTASSSFAFALGGTMWLLYLPAFFFFAGTGVFYLVLLVMFQDAIDYNEWKFGERKESIAFAWRPLDVKLGSGLQIGIRNFTFIITGTATALNAISNYEGLNNAGYYETADVVSKGETFNGDVTEALSKVTSGQLAAIGYIIIGIIIVAFLAGYLLLHFGFTIDEDTEKKIVAELAARHQADEAASAKTLPEASVSQSAPQA
jgi:Na+/melibiose symporter-like transporter